MDRIAAAREESQPLRSKTGGSTFKNPPGGKAWQLVDAAGCRGLKLGGAQVSEKHCGFVIKLCRPYRARTKGKVERFNGYLRRSFYVPLVAKLKQAGLQLDVVTANVEVRHWLKEVANVRIHGTTQCQPSERLQQEQAHLHAIPTEWRGDIAAARPLAATATPTTSDQSNARPAAVAECIATALPAQHPLAVYEQLLDAWRTDVAVMQ